MYDKKKRVGYIRGVREVCYTYILALVILFVWIATGKHIQYLQERYSDVTRAHSC